MAKTRPDTIILKGAPNFVEGQLSAAAKPGLHVIYGGANEFTPGSNAAAGVLRIVTEGDLTGKTIDDEIAVNENAVCHVPKPGDKLQLRIAAGAAAIAKGDLVKRGNNGYFTGGGVAADAVAECDVAVDNSGGGTDAFVQVTVI